MDHRYQEKLKTHGIVRILGNARNAYRLTHADESQLDSPTTYMVSYCVKRCRSFLVVLCHLGVAGVLSITIRDISMVRVWLIWSHRVHFRNGAEDESKHNRPRKVATAAVTTVCKRLARRFRCSNDTRPNSQVAYFSLQTCDSCWRRPNKVPVAGYFTF